MADVIGELGLGTKEFEASVERAAKALPQLERAVEKTTNTISSAEKSGYAFGQTLSRSIGNVGKALLAGLGIGSVVSFIGKIVNAREETEKFNAEVEKIGVDRSNPEFRSLDYFEKRIDTISAKLKELTGGPKGGISGYLSDAADILGEMAGKIGTDKWTDFLNPMAAARDIAGRKDTQQDTLMQEKKGAEESLAIRKQQEEEAENFRKREEAANERAWDRRDNALKEQARAAKQLAEDEAADEKHLADLREKHDDEEAKRGKDQLEKEKEEYKTWLDTKNRMEDEAYDNAEENRKFKEKKREEAIDEKLKSPDQRRAESREAAKRDRTGRAIDKAAQEAENTRAKNEGRKARDLKADVPGNGADGKKPSDGFSRTDSQNLQKVAAALTVRS